MLINSLEIIIPTDSILKQPPYNNNYIYFCPIPSLELTVLTEYLTKANNDGVKFTNLILSSSQEISDLPLMQIANCLDIIRPFFHLFQYKYVKTNGSLLKSINHVKFMQFYLDFLVKIPRFAVDDLTDNSFFGRSNFEPHIHDYSNFSSAKICWELICLNDSSYQSFSKTINELITKYNNSTDSIFINTAKIYGTNINALNIREIDFANWILTFGYRRRNISSSSISKNLDDDLLDYTNTLTQNRGLEFKEYWEWDYREKRIIMNKPTNLQIRYNKNYIFYGNKLIDYDGNTIV